VKFKLETEFQDTEIGKIPKEWRIEKLRRIVKYVKGKKPSGLFDEKSSEEYIPYLTAEYMRGLDKPKWCNPKLENSVVEVSRDDVIMIWDGSYAGHVFTGFNGVLASTMVKITPIVELDKKFLYYYLLVNFEKFRSTTVGTGIPHVNKKVFEEFPIPVPPIHEQKRIAEILSTVDRVIESVDVAIARLEGLKKALMSVLLSGRIRVREENSKLVFYREVNFQETEIGKIPREWKVVKLRTISTFAKRGKTPKYGNSELLVIKTAHNYPDGIRFEEAPQASEEFLANLPKEFYLKLGDILINSTGTGSVGRVGFFESYHKPCTVDGHITILRVDQNVVIPKYVFYYLSSPSGQRVLLSKVSGSTHQVELYVNEILDLALPLQSLEEQQRIVEIFSMIDQAIKLYREERIRLDHLKRSLMDLLLSGRVRVLG
jgi:type I restriction enzyme S subunit